MGCCQGPASRRSAKQAENEAGKFDHDGVALLGSEDDLDLEAQDTFDSGYGDAAQAALELLNGYADGEARRLVIGEFVMLMGPDDIMGEGSFSICRKGIHLRTGEVVAIKTFKDDGGDAEAQAVQLQKFVKQINILEDLAKPLRVPEDSSLWNPQLNNVKAEDLFMKIIDYSKTVDGEPGPDPTDGVLYLVTELASYSLDDYLYERSELDRPISRHAVQELCRGILLVMAGLHAKGLCHLDLKPENLMLFNSRMKLIDVDGCVSTGDKVALGDASVSFSPAFCAPEWASWMTTDTESDWISVQPSLDAWSVGMTLCQLITLDVVLEEKYAEFSGKNARSEFLTWLGSLQEPPVPDSVRLFDPGLMELIDRLLICNKKKRKTIASCLDCSFVTTSSGSDNRVVLDEEEEETAEEFAGVTRSLRRVGEVMQDDTSTTAPVFKDLAWVLGVDCEAEEPTSWERCDLWITQDSNLCLYDIRDGKRCVYLPRKELQACQVNSDQVVTRGYIVELKSPAGSWKFAFDDKESQAKWVNALTVAISAAASPPSKKDKGGNHILRILVNNRRMAVPNSSRRDYEPVFRAVLWKLACGSDGSKKEHWLARELWISINFNLVYFSVKEDRELVYYNAQDLERATVVRMKQGNMTMPWVFQVVVPPQGGVELTPGVFATVSKAARERWIQEFQVQQVRRSGHVEARASTLRRILCTGGGQAAMADAAKGDFQQLQLLADASQRTRMEPEAEPQSCAAADDCAAAAAMEDELEEDDGATQADGKAAKTKKGKGKAKAKGKAAAKKQAATAAADNDQGQSTAAAADAKNEVGLGSVLAAKKAGKKLASAPKAAGEGAGKKAGDEKDKKKSVKPTNKKPKEKGDQPPAADDQV